jgi:large subunit ribosomal protein L21
MFAVVRTGGKQYRVAPGDKIVVEKLDGNAGDKVTLGEVLLAGEGGNLRSTDGLTVAAEIVAQAKGEKVTVFKKRRRHNYRRKKGHRQQHTILKIVAIGDHKAEKPAKKADAAPKAAVTETPAAPAKAPKQKPAEGEQLTPSEGAGDVAGKPTPNPAPDNADQAGAEKPAAKKAAPNKAEKSAGGSTQNAAPAKAAAKKAPKAK